MNDYDDDDDCDGVFANNQRLLVEVRRWSGLAPAISLPIHKQSAKCSDISLRHCKLLLCRARTARRSQHAPSSPPLPSHIRRAAAPPADAVPAEPAAAAAPAVEMPSVPLTRKVIKKRQRKTDCKVTEFVEGTIADAVMAEYRQQEASMGAQVSSSSLAARCVA